MASSLSVIALISGGKDSLFSILHCQKNGHTIVALANLHPTPSTNNDEDINSYMYQTVGHSIIPLYEAALGIPLYRQVITGTAVDSSRDYDKSRGQEQDETEDLVPLLEKILKEHPQANALSTGAILSTYQRTRIESVALRLGLTPLSYLWQYPLLPPYSQSALLHDMASVRQEAVIIKTASGGLDDSFLGLDVAAPRTIAKLGMAMARYGEATNGAIVGEGGEFETLALGGPNSLWKKRIRLDSTATETLDGGQAVLKIQNSSLGDNDLATDSAPLRIPELFDEEFRRTLECSDQCEETDSPSTETLTGSMATEGITSSSTESSSCASLPINSCADSPSIFTYSNLVDDTQSSSSDTPSRQLARILLRLDHVLKQRHLSKGHINHCTLLLRNMSDFTILNPEYAQYFSLVNPPARATIAVGETMPPGIDVMLSIILDKPHNLTSSDKPTPLNRQGLHVQSRSYWAPANIGPYSQAISFPLPSSTAPTDPSSPNEIVYVAGQIPLIPASMTVSTAHGFTGQAVLSLQHLFRIGRAKKVKWWTTAVAFIPSSPDPSAGEKVRIAQRVWRAVHTPATASSSAYGDDDDEEEEDVDPWDRLNKRSETTYNDNTYRAPIPDFAAVNGGKDASDTLYPPCFVVQVDSLPRDVDIEWSATGLTSRISTTRETNSAVTVTAALETKAALYTLEIRNAGDLERLSAGGGDGVMEWTNATLYAGRGFHPPETMSWKGVQWIPCRRVWGEDGREVQAVIVGRVDST